MVAKMKEMAGEISGRATDPLTLPSAGDGQEPVFYEALVESLSALGEGLMVVENRRFVLVNQRLCDLTGYTAEELRAQEFFLPLFHPNEWARILDRYVRRIAGEKFDSRYETALLHRKGQRIDVEQSEAFLPHGSGRAVVFIVRDLQAHRPVEEAVRKKNEDLEQLKVTLEKKVRERTLELEKANKQLTKLNQVKSDFISIVSHELRTPLTSIKSFAEIMLDDLGEHDLETQRRYLSIINSESDRLSRLISDILDLQKIDSGKVDWNDEMINVVDIVQRAVETFSTAYAEKGLRLDFASESSLMMTEASPDRLFQVFANLLSNALKFTERGGVDVNMRFVEAPYPYSSDKTIRISVTDTGIGIPREELRRIFDRFYQVDHSQGRKHEGAGLGLAISKDIIEHYQGELSVESTLGSGATFYVSLPEQKLPRKKLGEVLIELGMLTETELASALKKQEG